MTGVKLKIIQEDLSIVRRAIGMLDLELLSQDQRLEFLGLIHIIEEYHLDFMKVTNSHVSGIVTQIILAELDRDGNTGNSLTALNYTLRELEEKLKEDEKNA